MNLLYRKAIAGPLVQINILITLTLIAFHIPTTYESGHNLKMTAEKNLEATRNFNGNKGTTFNLQDGSGDIGPNEENGACVSVDSRDILTTVDDGLLYRVEAHPPLYLTIFMGIQQALLSLTPSLVVSTLVADVTCASNDVTLKAKLLSATLFMNGITTLAMNIFGIRLPLFQGAAGHFLIPLLAMQVVDPRKCDRLYTDSADTNSSSNWTVEKSNMKAEFIMNSIQALQGSLIAAGIFEFLIGFTGLVGLLLKFIGPITIVPTILLSGVYFVKAGLKFAQVHWGISLMTAAIAITLSLYLSKYKMPIPVWSPTGGCRVIKYPLHQVLSILISTLIGWALSAVVTYAGGFPSDPKHSGYLSRTDARLKIVQDFPWIDVPYPGKFGPISFNISVFIGFLIAIVTSVLDSVGDYYACARMADVPPPPRHAVNRGIAIEGICSALSGVLGCGHATSTYAGNIGAIGLTKVASRDVFIVAGFIYIIFGILGKVSAVFITIPYPVLGGVLIVMYGMFNGVVLSNLDVVSLSSSRNLAIIGISFFFGLLIPLWVEKNPTGIDTGSKVWDSVIKIMLANPNLPGGFLACFLDNTVPGNPDDRGITAWQKQIQETNEGDGVTIPKYDVYAPLLPERLRKNKLLRRLPFIPNDYHPIKTNRVM